MVSVDIILQQPPGRTNRDRLLLPKPLRPGTKRSSMPMYLAP